MTSGEIESPLFHNIVSPIYIMFTSVYNQRHTFLFIFIPNKCLCGELHVTIATCIKLFPENKVCELMKFDTFKGIS